MKYVVLLAEPDHWNRWGALDEASRQAVFDTFHAFAERLAERGGAVVGGEGLDSPDTARTLGPGPERVVSDGPYAESVEQLGGFFLVEATTADDVIEAARVMPETWSIEVRPVAGSVEP